MHSENSLSRRELEKKIDLVDKFVTHLEPLLISAVSRAWKKYRENSADSAPMEFCLPFDPLKTLDLDCRLFSLIRESKIDESLQHKCFHLVEGMIDGERPMPRMPKNMVIHLCPLYTCSWMFSRPGHLDCAAHQLNSLGANSILDVNSPLYSRAKYWFQINSAIVIEMEWKNSGKTTGDIQRDYASTYPLQRYVTLSTHFMNHCCQPGAFVDEGNILAFETSRGTFRMRTSDNPVTIPNDFQLSVGACIRIVGFVPASSSKTERGPATRQCPIACVIESVIPLKLYDITDSQSFVDHIPHSLSSNVNIEKEANGFSQFLAAIFSNRSKSLTNPSSHYFDRVSLLALFSIHISASAEIFMQHRPHSRILTLSRGRIHLELKQHLDESSLIYSTVQRVCAQRGLSVRRFCHQVPNIIPCAMSYPSTGFVRKTTKIARGFMASGPGLYFIPFIQMVPKSKYLTIKSAICQTDCYEDSYNDMTIVDRDRGDSHHVKCSGTLCFTSLLEENISKTSCKEKSISPDLSVCFSAQSALSFETRNLYTHSLAQAHYDSVGPMLPTGRPRKFSDESVMLLDRYIAHLESQKSLIFFEDPSTIDRQGTRSKIEASSTFDVGGENDSVCSVVTCRSSGSAYHLSNTKQLYKLALASTAARGENDVGVVDALIAITLYRLSGQTETKSEYTIFSRDDTVTAFLSRVLDLESSHSHDFVNILQGQPDSPCIRKLAIFLAHIISILNNL